MSLLRDHRNQSQLIGNYLLLGKLAGIFIVAGLHPSRPGSGPVFTYSFMQPGLF
jgi:hypothetical protein